MSAQVKKHTTKAAKIAGIILFVFLMFFNIQFAVGDNSKGDIDLFGLKISVFTPSAYATGGGSYCEHIEEAPTYCMSPSMNCMCDIIVRP